MRLRKISGWILVFAPVVLTTVGLRCLPTEVSVRLMQILAVFGLISVNFAGTCLVVFDIHGEYAQLSYARNIKIGKDFAFPIWLFGLSGMTSNILKIREHAYSNGTLKKGTRVTCKDVRKVGSDIWIKIPSGWIAAYYGGKKYVG